jgi:transposase
MLIPVLPGTTPASRVRATVFGPANRKGWSSMEVVHERCAGLDVSKRDVKVCVRSPGKRRGSYAKSVSTFGSVTAEILRLRDHLITANVTLVVMEATGDYWKPFYYLLEHAPFQLMLVNPTHARNIPGRKSDVSDAQWLAELAAHGLVRGSFVPPPPIRVLRDLTRARVTLTQDRVREINRLDKVLEDAGIKLSSVASDILGVSGRAILDALVAGERDPRVLAALARMSLRNKTEQLTAALVGRFTEHHAFMVRLHLQLIDQLAAGIAELTARIDVMIEPFRPILKLLTTIPGVSDKVAVVIIAETGADMTRFPTAAHLASWAGVCPSQNESAGRTKSTSPRPGNSYIKAALGNAAMGAARTNGCYLQARYRRLAARSSALKALVAIEHSILVSVWNMITNNQSYHDLGGDYYARRDPAAAMRRIVRQANALGMNVRFDPIEQPI